MSPILHQSTALLILGLMALHGSPLQAGEVTATDDPDSLEALFKETEDLVEGPSPTEKQPLGEQDSGTTFVALGSVQAGPGYSSNYLKATTAQESAYLHAEADSWLGWFGPAWSTSAYVFAETNLYEEEKEFLTLSRFTGRVSREALDFGTEVMVIYGDQVYDSSLIDSTGTPTGLLIEQFLPKVSIFVDWFATRRNRFKLQPFIQRVEFDLANQDYWEPGVEVEWEHLWTRTVRSETRLRVAREIYDDDVPRLANGSPVEGAGTLAVNSLGLVQEISWKPRKWLEMKAFAGISREEDSDGAYKDMTRTWGGGTLKLDGSRGKISLNGRYSVLDYESRLAGLDTARQTYLHASIEYEHPLPWDLVLHLKGSWAEVDSRTQLESYQEERGELLLEWHY